MNYKREMAEFPGRKLDVLTNKIKNLDPKRRMKGAAEALSRNGVARLKAELCNEAVEALIRYVYEPDPDFGASANVDADGQVLMPVPWGRSHQRWGLRRPEAEALRHHMLRLSQTADPPPLFSYDDYARRWVVNIDYPTLAEALDYWREV